MATAQHPSSSGHMVDRERHDVYSFISPAEGMKNAASGKRILVTGGGKGIGKAIALSFARAGAASVTIVGRTQEALAEAKSAIEKDVSGCTITTIKADVTTDSSASHIFQQLGDAPDVLVNNAGSATSQTRLAESDPTIWWKEWELNVKAPYLLSKAFLLARAGKPGVILNVSTSVSNATSNGLSAYGPSKTAVNRLTEYLDFEYSKEGLQCIAWHPGGVAETGMGQAAPPQYRGYLYDTVMLPGATAVYLATDRAKYLSGRFVFGNWDMEKLEARKDEIVSKDLFKMRLTLPDWCDISLKPPT